MTVVGMGVCLKEKGGEVLVLLSSEELVHLPHEFPEELLAQQLLPE
jgi:hypothetical protein